MVIRLFGAIINTIMLFSTQFASVLLPTLVALASAQCGPNGDQTYPPGTNTCPSGPSTGGGGGGGGGRGGTACAADSSDYSYAETVDSTTRTIVTNHCPVSYVN